MTTHFLRLPDVILFTGLSRSTIYDRIAAGRFPKPVQLGSQNVVGWISDEVDEWIAATVAAARTTTHPQ